MELCDLNLSEYSRTHVDANAEIKIDLANQMSKAVAYLHQLGMIHKDIKPSNFLLKIIKNGKLVVKLTDLGLSKRLMDSANHLSSKFNYTALAWIAPELYTPPFHFSAASDIWALGCVIYFLFTRGRHPFDSPDGTTVVGRANNIVQQKINLTHLQNQDSQVIEPFVKNSLILLVHSMVGNTSSRPDANEVVNKLKRLEISGAKSKQKKNQDNKSKKAITYDDTFESNGSGKTAWGPWGVLVKFGSVVRSLYSSSSSFEESQRKREKLVGELIKNKQHFKKKKETGEKGSERKRIKN